MNGTFKNEKGEFSLSWCVPTGTDEITFTLSLAGTSYVALGFGGSMKDADMIVGWVTTSGGKSFVSNSSVVLFFLFGNLIQMLLLMIITLSRKKSRKPMYL